MVMQPADAFLNELYIEQMVAPYLENNLHFNKIFQPIDLTTEKFQYIERNLTISKQIEDGIQSRPLPVGEATHLSEMKISRSEPKDGRTYKIGYKVEFSRNDILEMNSENPDAISDYNWTLNSLGFGIANDVNYLILNAMKEGASAPKLTLDAEHKIDQPEQNPLKVLKDMFYAQKNKNLLQKINTYYMETTAVQTILDYCDSRDIPYSISGPGQNIITIDKQQVRNFTIVDVDDMLDYGESVNMCQVPGVYPGADFYRVFDPKFSVQKANNTDVGDPTALQINVTEQDESPHKTIIEAWLNCGMAVKTGLAIQDQDGLLTAEG
jgi:hypothetical protein